MPDVEIIHASSSDLSALISIAKQTFIETFAHANDPLDFARYLSRAFEEEKIRDEFQTVGSDFYLARVDGEIAGYLKLNVGDAQTEYVSGRTVEIERIYVEGAMQGTGVGKALFEFALGKAQDLHAEAIWLGVWEENPKAIRFYEQQGFRPFGIHTFTIGEVAQNDIMMRLDLHS